MTLQSYWPSLERLLLKPLSTATATFAFEQIPQPILNVASASWSCSFLQNLRMKLKTSQPLICSFKPLFLWKIISVILLYDDGTEQCSRCQMLCPFTGPKIFCACPNFLSQPKNLTAFSTFSKTFVPAQKTILLNANLLYDWHKMLVTGTICKEILGLAQKNLDQHKTFMDL